MLESIFTTASLTSGFQRQLEVDVGAAMGEWGGGGGARGQIFLLLLI